MLILRYGIIYTLLFKASLHAMSLLRYNYIIGFYYVTIYSLLLGYNYTLGLYSLQQSVFSLLCKYTKMYYLFML